MYEFLDRRYAAALYEVGEKLGRVDEYLDSLKIISEVIYDSEGIYLILKNPNISTRRKKIAFTELFQGKIHPELLSFLLILIDKGRILHLKEKIKEMEKIRLERNNTLIAEVKTAVPLNDNQRCALVSKLEVMYHRKFILNEEIDTDIIAGVWVKVGSNTIDGTIKSKLQEIRETAMKIKWR